MSKCYFQAATRVPVTMRWGDVPVGATARAADGERYTRLGTDHDWAMIGRDDGGEDMCVGLEATAHDVQLPEPAPVNPSDVDWGAVHRGEVDAPAAIVVPERDSDGDKRTPHEDALTTWKSGNTMWDRQCERHVESEAAQYDADTGCLVWQRGRGEAKAEQPKAVEPPACMVCDGEPAQAGENMCRRCNRYRSNTDEPPDGMARRYRHLEYGHTYTWRGTFYEADGSGDICTSGAMAFCVERSWVEPIADLSDEDARTSAPADLLSGRGYRLIGSTGIEYAEPPISQADCAAKGHPMFPTSTRCSACGWEMPRPGRHEPEHITRAIHILDHTRAHTERCNEHVFTRSRAAANIVPRSEWPTTKLGEDRFGRDVVLADVVPEDAKVRRVPVLLSDHCSYHSGPFQRCHRDCDRLEYRSPGCMTWHEVTP